MPKIIEFTGMPNSGKTTLIHNLRSKLQANHGITVQIQREDAEVVPKTIPKKTWNRNLWITFGQFQSLVEAQHANTDVVFLDRGMFDAFFWSKFMYSQKVATEKQSLGMQKIISQIYKNIELYPDAIILVDVSVEESLKRRSLMEGQSVYSKPDYLKQYQQKFFEVFKPYIENDDSKKIIPVPSFYIDTTNLNKEEVTEIVEHEIVKLCKNEWTQALAAYNLIGGFYILIQMVKIKNLYKSLINML